jgi:hypothetical protein
MPYITSMDSISLNTLLSVPRHPVRQIHDPAHPATRDLMSPFCLLQPARSSPFKISDILEDALQLCEDSDDLFGDHRGDNAFSRANRLPRQRSQGRSGPTRQEQHWPKDQ